MKYTPLMVFLAICLALAFGLATKDKPDVNISRMVGQTIEPFSLKMLDKTSEHTIPRAGKVTVVNIFASWCESCQVEHAVLLAAKDKLSVVGIGWKDTPQKLGAWLKQRGNPYETVLMDEKGASTLKLGLSGVPETFVIDKHGVVAYNKKAPVTDEDIAQVILPLVEKLNAQ